MNRTPYEKPVYWIIQVEVGWLLRRFWMGRYETLLTLPTRAEAEKQLRALDYYCRGVE